MATPLLAWSQVVDLVANNSGPINAFQGDGFEYVVTLTNNGQVAADGASFNISMPLRAQNVAATCSVEKAGDSVLGPDTGVTECPASFTIGNTLVAGVLPYLADQGEIKIRVTGSFGVGQSTVSSTAVIAVPDGFTEQVPSSNSSTVNTALGGDARLNVTKVMEPANPGPNDPVTYTVTFTNEGQAAVDGVIIRDHLTTTSSTSQYLSSLNADYLGCTTTGLAECPPDSEFVNGDLPSIGNSYGSYLFNTPAPKLPAGSSIQVRYTLSATPLTSCGISTHTLSNRAMFVNLPAGITNTGDTGLNSPYVRWQFPATASCPEANLAVTKTQTTPVSNPDGSWSTRYTIVARNDGVDAHGARLADYAQFTRNAGNATSTAHFVSCTPAGGAVCPTLPQTTTAMRPMFSETIDTFPANSSLTIVYDMVVTENTQCGIDAQQFENQARLSPPAGFQVRQRTDTVQTPIAATLPCPPAEFEIEKTQSTQTPISGVPFEYVVTVRNVGDVTADGAMWRDAMTATGLGAEFDATIVFNGCEATGGATCPPNNQFQTYNTRRSLNASGNGITYLLGSTPNYTSGRPIPQFPAKSDLTFRYTVTPYFDKDSCINGSGIISNSTVIRAPVGVTAETKSATVQMPVSCADVAITKAVLVEGQPSSFVTAGQALSYTIDLTNAGPGVANDVVFLDELPEAFVYNHQDGVSVRCESTGTVPAQCGDTITYDSSTHTLRSTIAALPANSRLRFTVTGVAGSEPGTYTNVAHAEIPTGLIDVNMGSNSSDVSIQIRNTQSPFTVTKVVDGLTQGLPVAMTFSGTVTCGAQPTQNWSIAIAAGATTGTSAPLTFYDREVCTVTENSPLPALPAGYEWVGSPQIANTTDTLGPTTARNVVVTNTARGWPQVATAKQLTQESGSRPGYAEAGERLDYTIRARNTGTGVATSHQFFEVLPAHTTLQAIIGGTSHDCAAGQSGPAVCTITVTEPIAVNSERQVVVQLQVIDPLPANVTELVNLITDDTTAPPPTVCDPTRPEHCVRTPLLDPAVTVRKSADPASGTAVKIDDEITYTLAVTVSNAPTKGVVHLHDTLGNGLELVSGSTTAPAGSACSVNPQLVHCELAANAAVGNHFFSYRAKVTADAVTSVRNSVAISGDDDPTCTNCTTEHRLVPPPEDATPVPVGGRWWILMLALLVAMHLHRRQRPSL
ncbi:DUF5979 domain-containing protein [Lampropedia puyangensis]|uniref:DUF5979 domain-containing protein n=1 Tax=Lampropedia puyangensis TaxID=1330072 RepID=UPI0013053330|nr:DUF5979 domain-containing protein [Lampropedia puyangensis]